MNASTASSVRFNLTKFCFLAGNVIGVSEAYRITVLVVFSIIDFLILLANVTALFTVVKNRRHFFKKEKIFILVLLIHDLLSGCTVIPLFIVELSIRRVEVDCVLSSLRVIFFGYLLSCRILGIFFISFQTYVKTNLQKTLFEERFHRHSHLINIVFVWMPGIIFVLAIGFSGIKTDNVLGTVIFAPIVIILACSIIFYMMVLRVIKGATGRLRRHSRQEPVLYDEAALYLKKVLIWFLLTNIPLCACGLALLIYSFYQKEKKRHNLVVQQIYIIALAVTSLDAIINPCLLVWKHRDLNTYVKGSFKRVASRSWIMRVSNKENNVFDDVGTNKEIGDLGSNNTFKGPNMGYEDTENIGSNHTLKGTNMGYEDTENKGSNHSFKGQNTGYGDAENQE